MGYETRDFWEVAMSTEITNENCDWREIDNYNEVKLSSQEDNKPVEMYLYGNKLYQALETGEKRCLYKYSPLLCEAHFRIVER